MTSSDSEHGRGSEGAAVALPSRPKNPTGVVLGLILILFIGAAAYFLSRLHPSLDALVMAIVLGIACRVVLADRAARFLPGIQLGVQILIPVGIILYGTNLDFQRLATLSGTVILLTLLCMAVFYTSIFLLSRLWKVRRKTGELIAAGSAVCGASAIAVVSPVTEADPEDISVSLLVITAVGLLGAMVYPILKELLGMSDIVYAVFSGATLHQTGIVKIAVSAMEPEMVSYALAVKTTRIVMLVVVAFLMGWSHSRTQENESIFSVLRRVWFILPFVLVGLLISFVPATQSFLTSLRPAATIVFSLALGSIGLLVDIESVLLMGIRPLLTGLLGWIGAILVFLGIAPLVF